MLLLRIFLYGTALCLLLLGCSGQETDSTTEEPQAKQKLVVQVEATEPLDVPARVEPKSDTDWEAIANNKNVEIIEVLNIIGPVAAYITAAFEQYGDKFGEVTQEEWVDTRAQLTKASAVYEDCKERMDKKEYSKQLFLDLEEAWQIFVKVGVAGIRAKAMVDADLGRIG